MVIIRNRTIMWTNHEQYIGTSYDNNSETRIFQVNRILPAGTDIADFVFNITIKFSNGQNSVIMLGKEVVDDVINLTWQIGRNSLLAPGPAFVQISATDSYGSIKWSTYESAVYIGNYIDYEHAGDVEMSEFERLEAYYYDLARKMVAVFESEELRETNEATRQTNEAQRAQETEDLIARSEEALRIAEGAVGTVSEKLGLAKSYAVGDEEAREGSSTDNAKYYKEQIQAFANQISTNAENIAEEVERATTAEAEETERAETAETALMNTIKNAITDEYSASTTYNADNPYCIYENKLYKLKVASSTGNLPTNTSYWDPVNVADEIKALNSKSTIYEEYLTFTYNGDSINFYFRYNKLFICVLMIKDDKTMTLPTSWTSVGKLSGCKPPSDRYIPFVAVNGYSGTIRIYQDGGVRVIGNSSDPMWLQTSGMCSM